MNVVCENVDDSFCESLRAVGCCDFYEDGVAYVRAPKQVNRFADEYDIVDGVVYSVAGGVGSGGGCGSDGGCGADDDYVSRVSSEGKESDYDEMCGRLLMREPIQLLHDLSIQLRRLHSECVTFTDIDISDIAVVDGHFCVIAVDKLVGFDKESGCGTLFSPVAMGRFKAPEMCDVTAIPAVDAVHRNSAVWSIGMMFARCVFGIRSGDTCCCDDAGCGSGSSDSSDSIYDALSSRMFGTSQLVAIVRRCVHPVSASRMLIVV